MKRTIGSSGKRNQLSQVVFVLSGILILLMSVFQICFGASVLSDSSNDLERNIGCGLIVLGVISMILSVALMSSYSDVT